MNACPRDSRDAVSVMVEKAANAGGKADPNPTQEFGFMYGRSFEDPDGHIWEVMWMDPAAARLTRNSRSPWRWGEMIEEGRGR